MNNIVVLSDLDSTLLRDDSEVSDYTLNIINKMQAAGHMFIPCTARPYKELPKSLLKADLRYFVCSNGATIYDVKKKELVASYALDTDLAFSVLDEIDLDRTYLNLVLNGVVYSEDKLFDMFVERNVIPAEHIEGFKASRIVKEDNYSFLKTLKAIDKLHLNFESIEVRDEIKKMISHSDHYTVVSSDDLNIEVTNIASDKGLAGKEVAKLLNTNAYKLYAFGDNFNDISMFKLADISVAMKNGNEGIFDHATRISDYTNDQDGVAKYIEEFIL